jgi:hypothetical protein
MVQDVRGSRGTGAAFQAPRPCRALTDQGFLRLPSGRGAGPIACAFLSRRPLQQGIVTKHTSINRPMVGLLAGYPNCR